MKNSKSLKTLVYAVLYPISAVEIAFLIVEIASQFSDHNLLTGNPVCQGSWFLCFISLAFIYILISAITSVHCLINGKKVPAAFEPFVKHYSKGVKERTGNIARGIAGLTNIMLLSLGEGLLFLSQNVRTGKALGIAAGTVLMIASLITIGLEYYFRHKGNSPEERPAPEA